MVYGYGLCACVVCVCARVRACVYVRVVCVWCVCVHVWCGVCVYVSVFACVCERERLVNGKSGSLGTLLNSSPSPSPHRALPVPECHSKPAAVPQQPHPLLQLCPALSLL